MSGYNPYNGFEPNEPTVPAGKPRSMSPAGQINREPSRSLFAQENDGNTAYTPDPSAARPPASARANARRAWVEEDYLPNEPRPATPRAADPYEPQAAAQPSRGMRPENPYARPTWDETTYEPEPDATDAGLDAWNEPPASEGGAAYRTGDFAQPDGDDGFAADAASRAAAAAIRKNPYARPAESTADGVSDLSARFAPPLKFELLKASYADPLDGNDLSRSAEPNVYQTRRPAARSVGGAGFDPIPRSGDYRVEADSVSPAKAKRRRRKVRRWLAALVILAALGTVAYLNRNWLLSQLKPLLGEETIQSVHQAIEGSQPAVAGYDPAPTLQVGASAKKAISAVAGGIGLETYAVTGSNVIARAPRGDGRYDLYLFAAKNGLLLGYYENLGEDDFLVCAGDTYYVPEPPYLIDGQGQPLIDKSSYAQSAGADAVLGPLTNGWSIIRKADGTASNYINAEGKLLSTLWFAKAYPFTAGSTLAYVDTGNVTDPEERYTLYELTHEGEMKLWTHTADMTGVLGCAGGVAYMATGDLIRLDGLQKPLCTTDNVSVYADCAAAVVRDPKTGLYGLFVNGEQHYDFAYDSIAPVPSDIQWKSVQNGAYTLYTVTGVAYPLPLSHYFALRKGDKQEMVALSTGSVYPLLLND